RGGTGAGSSDLLSARTVDSSPPGATAGRTFNPGIACSTLRASGVTGAGSAVAVVCGGAADSIARGGWAVARTTLEPVYIHRPMITASASATTPAAIATQRMAFE